MQVKRVIVYGICFEFYFNLGDDRWLHIALTHHVEVLHDFTNIKAKEYGNIYSFLKLRSRTAIL